MNSLRRFLKKFFIVLIVFSFLGGIVWLATRPKKDPCFNGRKDTGEVGVDCGGFCAAACPKQGKPDNAADIKINWVKFVENGRNNYDFVASLSNENKEWGVVNAAYEFIYYDASGKEIGRKQGNTFISPKGNTSDPSVKYIVEDNVDSVIPPAKVEFKLSNDEWGSIIDEKELGYLNENVIQISGKDFGMDDNLKAYRATGITKNTSKYDFIRVDINVVVFGKNDEVLAVGKTNQLTVVAGDGWGFTIVWPNLKIDRGQVDHVDYRAETNVFDTNNFMKEYSAGSN